MSDPVVETRYGRVGGSYDGEVAVFKGVPYGATTAGKARFLPPSLPQPWSGVRPALQYGPSAPQPRVPSPFARHPVLSEIMPARQLTDSSEDCLVLNVWSRGLGDGGKRPVMVWLHGGGWTAGSGGSSIYDGCSLAMRGDVVVVTINHRLGLPGYLYLGDILGGEYERSGAAGVLDMVLALEWVRDNIEAFGGDPGNVTIFGESGGAVKVQTLLGMPAAQGLFHRAVMESGSARHWATREEGTALARAVLDELGLAPERAAELLDVPADRLIEVQRALLRLNPRSALVGSLSGLSFMPVINGTDLPVNPATAIAAGSGADVALIVGSNKDEAAYFLAGDPELPNVTIEAVRERMRSALQDAADPLVETYLRTRPDISASDLLIGIGSGIEHKRVRMVAENKVPASRAPVFTYLFTWETPIAGGVLKSPHTLEIPFVFDNVDSTPITGDGPERASLAATLSSTWIAFARNGDPNHEGLPHWPAFQQAAPATMTFDSEPKVEPNVFAEEMQAWNRLRERILR